MTADATRPCRSIAVGILTVAALAGAPAAAHAQDADSAIPHRPDVTVEEYIEYVVKDLDTTWSKVLRWPVLGSTHSVGTGPSQRGRSTGVSWVEGGAVLGAGQAGT